MTGVAVELCAGRAELTRASITAEAAEAGRVRGARYRVPSPIRAWRQVAGALGLPAADGAPDLAAEPDPRLRPERSAPTSGAVVADAFLRGEALGLPERARHVLGRVARCRTSALGTLRERCGACDWEQALARSCGDRHCPRCLSLAGARWLRAELERALPLAYFHLVFTLPPALKALCAGGASSRVRVVYTLLLRAARAAVVEVARSELGDPRARLALVEVLHTWNRSYTYHPHVHVIVAAGGLSGCGERWLAAAPGRCLLQADALRTAYRRALATELERALALGAAGRRGGLELDPSQADALRRSFATAYQHVYAKALMDPAQALGYLARYVSRAGFSDTRLVSYDPHGAGRVVYRTKLDEVVTCSRAEFVARLASHVLPARFHRVRRYELLAARSRPHLEAARALLGVEVAEAGEADEAEAADLEAGGSFVERFYLEQGVDLTRCPRCQGQLVRRNVPPADVDFADLHPRPAPARPP